jgi:hypothetical protein
MFLPIVLAIGAVTRIFRLFYSENVISQIAIGSSSLMLVLACAALMFLSTVISVVRFYKNMYSAEGYLTFTLPVTNEQHIFVKLTTALACHAICTITVIIAACIALSGQLLVDVFDVILKLLKSAGAIFGTFNTVIFAIELALMLILSVAQTLLLYYTCITVGQTAKKNRIIMAVAAYFVYYAATQAIATVFMIIFTVLGISGVFDGIEIWLESNIILATHIYFAFALLISAALAAVFWFVTKKIMTKKLNLE